MLSVTGGIPRYLEEIDPSLSAEENIRKQCFCPNAVLRTDFDEMFRDVITEQADFSAQVLRRLLDGPKSAAEIVAELELEKAICVVEIKRKREIGRDIIEEVDAKIKAIKRPDGVSAKAALVYDGHLSPVAKADGYFDAIIPFSKLLGL